MHGDTVVRTHGDLLELRIPDGLRLNPFQTSPQL